MFLERRGGTEGKSRKQTGRTQGANVFWVLSRAVVCMRVTTTRRPRLLCARVGGKIKLADVSWERLVTDGRSRESRDGGERGLRRIQTEAKILIAECCEHV